MADQPSPSTRALTRDDIIGAALRIVESAGITALTMRKLAAELGVAVTAIYWHVGNRRTLLEALVEAELADMEAIRPSGSTPQARIVSVARALRKRLLARRHVVELVNERGRIATLFTPAQVVLAREFLAAGLEGSAAALAVRTMQLHVIGSVILQRWEERQPHGTAPGPPIPGGRRRVAADPVAVTDASNAIPSEQVFEHSTKVLVAGLLGTR